MTNSTEIDNSNDPTKEIIKEDIKKQPYWHVLTFFSTYIGSYLIPGVIFFIYILFLFIPNVLNTSNLITLFTELGPLFSLLIMPIILISCYVMHIFLVGFITRFWWRLTEKNSPSKDGTIPRNIPSKTLNYYHIRSFMIKYPKNVVMKGIFPWLTNWMYNFIGTNVIGKGTTLEEQVCGEKFTDIGDNCYIGVNSIVATHFVEGIFGNIAFFKIKIGNNVTFSVFGCVAPGTEIGDNSYLLPLASAGKHSVLKGNNYYFGMPLRKIFKRKIQEYLQLTPNDFQIDEEIKQTKINRKIEEKKT